MLVLESAEQGVFKSSALQALCPDPEWFSDDLPLNVDSKQLIERTAGKWIVEASDLAGFRASQVEGLKGLLSRQVDGPVRLAYARLPVEAPRQFIIIGTTNSYTYLSDQTGNRRFWPVRIAAFDLPWITTHRDQVWAEAATREATGDSIRLDPALYADAATQQARRMYAHPWAEALSDEYAAQTGSLRVTPDDLWTFLAVPVERRTILGSRILAQAMQELGFRRISIRSPRGVIVRGWGKDT
jgi:predicted P-loop ATPase